MFFPVTDFNSIKYTYCILNYDVLSSQRLRSSDLISYALNGIKSFSNERQHFQNILPSDPHGVFQDPPGPIAALSFPTRYLVLVSEGSVTMGQAYPSVTMTLDPPYWGRKTSLYPKCRRTFQWYLHEFLPRRPFLPLVRSSASPDRLSWGSQHQLLAGDASRQLGSRTTV